MSDQINEVPATSPNFQSEVAQKLASLFPEVIADGKIDVAALQTLLGEDAAGGVSVLACSGQVKRKRSRQPKLLPPQHLRLTMKTPRTGRTRRTWSLRGITWKS